MQWTTAVVQVTKGCYQDHKPLRSCKTLQQDSCDQLMAAMRHASRTGLSCLVQGNARQKKATQSDRANNVGGKMAKQWKNFPLLHSVKSHRGCIECCTHFKPVTTSSVGCLVSLS